MLVQQKIFTFSIAKNGTQSNIFKQFLCLGKLVNTITFCSVKLYKYGCFFVT